MVPGAANGIAGHNAFCERSAVVRAVGADRENVRAAAHHNHPLPRRTAFHRRALGEISLRQAVLLEIGAFQICLSAHGWSLPSPSTCVGSVDMRPPADRRRERIAVRALRRPRSTRRTYGGCDAVIHSVSGWGRSRVRWGLQALISIFGCRPSPVPTENDLVARSVVGCHLRWLRTQPA